MHYTALGGMLRIPQFFVWRLVWNGIKGKYEKTPCFPDGSPYIADAKDPKNWMTYGDAFNAVTRLRRLNQNQSVAYALGFYFTPDCGYWFLDLDRCVSEGKLSQHAAQVCAQFNGAAWEWSASRNGLHIFGRGRAPEHGKRNKDFDMEFYTELRGVCFGLTDEVFGDADTDHTAAVNWLCANYFPPLVEGGDVPASVFDTPDAQWQGPADDVELIERIERSTRSDAMAVFTGVASNHATFVDLFDNNREVLARVYPGDSEADFAMISYLAFWTGRDAPRIERIMRSSELYRPKWDEMRGEVTYLRYSILNLLQTHLSEGRPVYGAKRTQAPNTPEVAITSPVSPDVPLETTITADPSKWEAAREYQQKFNDATTGEELETVALNAQRDPRMTTDLAHSLARDLFRRFEALQIEKPISWCRSLLVPIKEATHVVAPKRQLTEFGNSDRMIDRFGQSLMHIVETDEWWKWTGSQWLRAYEQEIQYIAQETIRNLPQEMADLSPDQQAAFYKFAIESQRGAMAGNMVKIARSNPHVMRSFRVLDNKRLQLGVPNGSVDLLTGQLLPPNREHYITSMCDVEYHFDAVCPWFERTVSECFFDDPIMTAFFQRLMGYTLMGDPKEQVIVIPYGTGANGKSTVLGAIQDVLGDYARAAQSSTFVSNAADQRDESAGRPREDLLALRGGRFVYISEIDESAQLKEGFIKGITGGEKIKARGIHARNSVEFAPTFVPVMPVNHKPVVSGMDDGIWRRLLLVPFERSFKNDPTLEVDLHRAAKLKGERSGILRWLVQGAILYQRYGLMVPQKVQQATNQYRADLDYLQTFIDEACEVGDDKSCSVQEMLSAWRAWAQPRGYERYIGTATKLTQRLLAKNFKISRTKTMRGYAGIKPRSAANLIFTKNH